MTAARPIERAAKWSEYGYLGRLWGEANGYHSTPPDEELRAFVLALSRVIEGERG